MSQKLYWARVTTRPRKTLAIGLKWVVQKKFGDRAVLGESHVGWLQGVADASNDETMRESCQILIDAIREDGSVDVWIEE